MRNNCFRRQLNFCVAAMIMFRQLAFWLIILNLTVLAHAQEAHQALSDGSGVFTQAGFEKQDACGKCGSAICSCSSDSRWNLFTGAEFLYVRPHFSEAVAFAEGTQTLTTFDISGRPIHFGYGGGVRATIGASNEATSETLRFDYTNMDGDVEIDSTGPAGGFVVDPFGNVVGSVTIIDPSDVRVGTTINGGDLIETTSTVDLNVYDIMYVKSLVDCDDWLLQIDVGARIADVDQTYESAITLMGAPFSTGTFLADYLGAGPRVGMLGQRRVGERLTFTASAHGSLLLGDYNVASIVDFGGGAFVANTSHTQRRTIPVLETELGASWAATDSLVISTGWLLHAWNDLGVSGGTFGGIFNGADDANNMSFDGLFLRAEYRR